MRFLKKINELNDERISFLWDFFHETKDDGLNVSIDYNSNYQLLVITIEDPTEIYGHVWVSLEHKKPIADIIKRLVLLESGIVHHIEYYNRILKIYLFKKRVDNLI